MLKLVNTESHVHVPVFQVPYHLFILPHSLACLPAYLLKHIYRHPCVTVMTTAQEFTHPLSLVTGANGHLGNNVVRELCARGHPVRAGVRNPSNTEPFHGLDCTIVKIDVQDQNLMVEAMAGVDVVYAVAAVPFKRGNLNSKADTYDVNMRATEVLVLAAKAAGVRRVVFVSSIAALASKTLPHSEAHEYSEVSQNEYYNSKRDSDRLVLELSKQLGVDVVWVLPGAFVGGECFTITEPYRALWNIYSSKVPLDPNVHVNWSDVKDIARGCVNAASLGRSGQRYILAQERGNGIRDTVQILQEIFPKHNFRIPPLPSKIFMWILAWVLEKIAALTGTTPQIQPSLIDAFWGVRSDCDTTRARTELGYHPKDVPTTLRNAIEYLEANRHLVD